MFGGGGGTITFANNVGVGHQALANLTTATFNVGVGTQAGGSLVTGLRNTCIGCTANTSADSCVQSTALGYGAMATAGNQIMLGTVTETVYFPNAMITQGLVYEAINTASQSSTNAPTLSYETGGVFILGTTITANATLAVTNIPTDNTKSYTFLLLINKVPHDFILLRFKFRIQQALILPILVHRVLLPPYSMVERLVYLEQPIVLLFRVLL